MSEKARYSDHEKYLIEAISRGKVPVMWAATLEYQCKEGRYSPKSQHNHEAVEDQIHRL